MGFSSRPPLVQVQPVDGSMVGVKPLLTDNADGMSVRAGVADTGFAQLPFWLAKYSSPSCMACSAVTRPIFCGTPRMLSPSVTFTVVIEHGGKVPNSNRLGTWLLFSVRIVLTDGAKST